MGGLNLPKRDLIDAIRSVFLFNKKQFVVNGSGDAMHVELLPLPSFGEDFPFQVTGRIDGTDLIITIVPGTFHGLMPTMDGLPLTDFPELTIVGGATGTVYVWLKVNASLTVTSNFVGAYNFDYCIIDGGGTLPPDDLTAAFYYRRIITFLNGVALDPTQNINTNLDGIIQDSGLADGSGVLSTWQS